MNTARKVAGLEKRTNTRSAKGARLSLAFSAETRERFEAIRDKSQASSITEAVVDAVRLYEWFLDQREQQNDILVRPAGKEPMLVQFIF